MGQNTAEKEELLTTLLRIEEDLLRGRKALQALDQKIQNCDPSSDEFAELMLLIAEDNEKLSTAFGALAIFKAKNGIVGKSWYKQK